VARELAAEDAREHGEQAQLRDAIVRTVRWYLATAHAAGQMIETLRPGVIDASGDSSTTIGFADRAAAVAWYETEQPNIALIVRAACENGCDREAWQLAVTLVPLNATAGDLEEWLEIAELALDAAQRLGDRSGVAHVQLTRATALSLTHRPVEALAALRAAREILAETDEVLTLIDADNRLGLLCRTERNLDESAACFRRVLDQATQAGSLLWQAQALANLADAAEAAGGDSRSAGHAEQALALFERANAEPHMRIGPLLILARIRRKADRLDAAKDLLRQAAAMLDAAGTNRFLAYAVAFERAAQDLAAGDAEGAAENYRRCRDLARSLKDRGREVRAAAGLAEALTRLGHSCEAVDLARATVALSQEHATPFDTAAARWALSCALSADGREDEAAAVRASAARDLAAYTDPAALRLRASLLV
jgi:tetratricopeptide (TPR) repeat protein